MPCPRTCNRGEPESWRGALTFSLSRNKHFTNKFAKNIRAFVSLEIAAAAEADGDSASFMHLERAHVLGQASTREHVRVHFRMLVWAGGANLSPFQKMAVAPDPAILISMAQR
jgi:Protein of unknown function (DUF3703)